MRSAENVLGVIRERGKKGQPLEDIYRQLYNPNLYLLAYENLRSNAGVMTPGVTKETVDGMCMKKIQQIIEAVRHERYRWKPVRRTYIPKKSGKLRPLGLPTWSDKLLQEVMRLILEAYYEPQFSARSHAYRPGRGCHTALTEIRNVWAGTAWFIEGDISQCFDKLDHDVLMSILGEKLRDNRFLRLISTMLKAGYLEKWRWNATYSGTPQGGVISPILSNISLDKMDKFVENELIPCHTRGKRRRENPVQKQLRRKLRRAETQGDTAGIIALRKQRRQMPGIDPSDPTYRRLRYIRYADDFLLGFAGPKQEAEQIKARLRTLLCDTLKLELSEDKTAITHARSEFARFLGYQVGTSQVNDYIDQRGVRRASGVIHFRVPTDAINGRCNKYMKGGKPVGRSYMLNDSVYAIIRRYQEEYRGVVNYYAYARNVAALSKLQYVMKTSLLKTLANKLKCSVNEVVRRYKATISTDDATYQCLRVTVEREGKPPLVATFGGIPLRRRKDGATLPIHDRLLYLWNQRTDVLDRMNADRCEVCGREGNCEVHHVRKLADLHRVGRKDRPWWIQRMIALRRKTLVVCTGCHHDIHAGRPTVREVLAVTGEPDDGKLSRPVRRGADGEGA
jgi:group II intron reverse transcriptase/maturase